MPSVNEENEETQCLLNKGKAEETFYNVCKTLEENEENDSDLDVVNSIIGSLENEEESKRGLTSRSLVVDIHVPPPEPEVDNDIDNLGEPEVDEEEDAVSLNVTTTTSAARPCKHEVNRFQRCYSDGSTASPNLKRKGKVSN